MIRSATLAALVVLTWSQIASADKPSPPLKGKAPPEEKAPERAKRVETKKPFDFSDLGARDAASDKDVARVNERCVSDPMSREGPTPEEEARCNAAVAKLVARGKKAAPSILASLNTLDNDRSYYASNRLLFALGKIDDKKVRGAVLAGYSTIAKEELEDHTLVVHQLPEALESMLGAAPPAMIPWEEQPVTDGWEEHRLGAKTWQTFLGATEGKTRKQITLEHFAKSRKEKADDDAKKAYQAISFLVTRSPHEALKAADAYAKRKDLDSKIVVAFDSLKSEAEWRVEELKEAAGRRKRNF
jgi:hypothetical protein